MALCICLCCGAKYDCPETHHCIVECDTYSVPKVHKDFCIACKDAITSSAEVQVADDSDTRGD